VAKAIQCPSCGRKHSVTGLPDAPAFRCEGCGQRLKVPDQFRPSVMTSSRHIRPPDPGRPESTSVLPPRKATAAAAAPAAARATRSVRPRPTAPPPVGALRPDKRQQKEKKEKEKASLPVRVLAWVIALPLGLVATLWLARITGWLSGERLVDIFTGTGTARYIRLIAVAPVWALFTTLFLSLFLEGGRVLARRRSEKRAEANEQKRRGRRGEPEPLGVAADDPGGARRPGDGQRRRRTAAHRGGP
jgi:hypothetical protein